MVDPTSFNQLGLSSFVSGLSGNNFTTVIKAEYQKDLSAAAPHQRQLNQKTQKVAQYQQLAKLLDNFQVAAKKLTPEKFSKRTINLTSNSELKPNKLLNITVGSNAPLGKISLKVKQIASVHKVASGSHTASETALGISGNFKIKTNKTKGAEITISPEMSLNAIAKKINSLSIESGVSASVIKVSDNNFKLILSGKNTNETIVLQDTSSTITQQLGLSQADGTLKHTLNTPQPAKLTLNGLDLTRDTNQINDILPNTKLTLLNASPTETITVEILHNRQSTKEDIINFVEKYNELRQFILSQQKIIPGVGAAPNAHLFGDSILKNTSESIFKELTDSFDYKDNISGLKSLGLSFNKDNTLKVDEKKLDSYLVDDLNRVKAYFTGTSGKIGLAQRLLTNLKQWNGSANSILQKELKTLNHSISQNTSDINLIKKQADRRREQLISQYARLEQKIAASKLILRQLEAISKVRSQQ